MFAQLARAVQHAGRQVDAVDFTGRPHGLLQEWKVAASAASDFKHPVAGSQFQAGGGTAAQMPRNEQQPIEQADQAGKTIIAPRDERALAIHPLVGHAFRPLARADSCGPSAPRRLAEALAA